MASSGDQGYDPLVGEGFEVFMRQVLKDTKTPGAAVAVIKGDKTWSGGWGVADLATKEPVTPHTLFLTCSMTKSFTAALASKLVHSDNKSACGDIKWSTPLADLIKDDFVLQDEYATGHVTLEDALSHRTGMPRHDLSWINGAPGLKGMARSLRHLPLHNEIRTKFEYCNLMYHAVAHALETVTKRSMKDLLTSWLWGPLGMDETTWTVSDARTLARQSNGKINLAIGYRYDTKTQDLCPAPWSSLPPPNGAGGITSNVHDYANWVRHFLHPNAAALSEAATNDLSFARTSAGQRKPYIGERWYGLGLDSGVYRSHVLVSHAGALAGYMSRMLWIPDLDWGCVVMTNSYAFAEQYVIWRLVDDFLETPEGERHEVAGVVKQFFDDEAGRASTAWERLYPEAPPRGETGVRPAQPLPAYEGVYRHPAYNTFTIVVPEQDTGHGADRAGTQHASDATSCTLKLRGDPAPDSYLETHLSLEHVNGEHWLTHLWMGPGGVADSFGKARFEIAPNGKVSGLWMQAEPDIEDLALFERVDLSS